MVLVENMPTIRRGLIDLYLLSISTITPITPITTNAMKEGENGNIIRTEIEIETGIEIETETETDIVEMIEVPVTKEVILDEIAQCEACEGL